ncbi:MAG: glycosyltransferase [Planctomycetales bacterium]|nr:glycosyltransferase [Planctomycetales bacterium]
MQSSSADNDTTQCKLTVVIIGKNEEQFIAKSIASVLEATKQLPSEVIYVDSASTDRSIEEASKYPIRILQLKPDWHLSVAAGRYTGSLHSNGEYIFFLDGDAEADANWLTHAVDFMDNSPQYGACAGVLDEVYMTDEGEVVGGQNNVFGQDLNADVSDMKALGGLALYRKKALDEVGTVNPYLPTGEDDELCMRIRNAGYKIARIKGRMAVKYTEKRESLHEVFRRCRTKMYDYGAVIRYSSQYGAGLQYTLEMIPYIASFIVATIVAAIAIPFLIVKGQILILATIVVLALC